MADEGFRSGMQSSTTIWTGEARGGVVVSLFQGEILFGNGVRGACAAVETIDATDGDAFRGSLIVTLPDGSISRQGFEGQTTLRDTPERLRGSGTWRFESGSGPFADLTGGGVFDWRLDAAAYHATFRAAPRGD